MCACSYVQRAVACTAQRVRMQHVPERARARAHVRAAHSAARAHTSAVGARVRCVCAQTDAGALLKHERAV